MLLNAMDLVGRFQFSGIMSDNTGNTRVAQKLVLQAVNTCIPMSDVCHHMSLLCKDLTRLDMFKDMIGHLRLGLEGIGKTWFATICVAAISLQCCLPALYELLGAGIVKFGPKKVLLTGLFKSGSICGMNFEINLNWFIQVEGHIAKAIVCLESSQTNPADVYMYWIPICGCIKQVLNSNKNGFTMDNIRQIYEIINTCFCEQLRDGPADCYLVAFSLEPCM
ncbi:hypothetical protein PAXRUDRAFT_36763 [Paxillus rubicundulus Ve08.2h10]|uniref:DUF659 domain-containing protein n=1 Tax=Paxillus rubicundulus Ve08.2h10 TaxID=930991 RepID=A0A0D0CQK5_9AGAM|nr:hypothetical protein PAXRUDRAFT_36763 [Paxillus rubicundulus Ve08.2h10]